MVVSNKSTPIENQDLGGDFNQDAGYGEFAQYEVPEIVKPQRKKR